MKHLVDRLFKCGGNQECGTASLRLSILIGDTKSNISNQVSEYFSGCIPAETLKLKHHRILSPHQILEENQNLIPGCYSIGYGLPVIATDDSGDAVSVDIESGRVYLLSHDKFESDGLHRGWNEEMTDFLPVLPFTRANIIKTAEEDWDSIEDFIESLIHAYDQKKN
jgi:uncharacterized Fe-S center protein